MTRNCDQHSGISMSCQTCQLSTKKYHTIKFTAVPWNERRNVRLYQFVLPRQHHRFTSAKNRMMRKMIPVRPKVQPQDIQEKMRRWPNGHGHDHVFLLGHCQRHEENKTRQEEPEEFELVHKFDPSATSIGRTLKKERARLFNRIRGPKSQRWNVSDVCPQPQHLSELQSRWKSHL